jgi:hypothetical protein
MVAQKNMVSLAKLLRIMQGIGKKYNNIGLEKNSVVHSAFYKKSTTVECVLISKNQVFRIRCTFTNPAKK